ncbi:MAG: phosphoserine transaminase [Rhodospirillales bacterium]|nr:phosphoserine transaminase [Rhodospirillales bacterium]MCB9964600.1 phosphoserine transaminase [Rhodospirillales bacterium]
MQHPAQKPSNPCFSSGPCAKRPGWSVDALKKTGQGRSHRAGPMKKKLAAVIDQHRELLEIPTDYKVGIVPASDTGAVEMALWSLLGARPVDVFAWESFSKDWMKDITKELKLQNVRTFDAPYGDLPDMAQYNGAHDCVFVWNGTTSGVRLPNADWIPADRDGLTICDATSAVFAYDLPWEKLDVVTWSWQKVLGGEAAHGMIVLSPRAVARLESYTPDRPLPKIFRMTKGNQLNEGIFKGETINTPSMLAVEDCLDALGWVAQIGGLAATIRRSAENYQTLADWVRQSDWIDFLPEKEAIRSHTSICLKITDPWFSERISAEEQTDFIKNHIVKPLDTEGVAYDIAAYRDAPAGLRIWGGATVESADLKLLTGWLDWAYQTAKDHAAKNRAA